jgi:hypothetical protein
MKNDVSRPRLFTISVTDNQCDLIGGGEVASPRMNTGCSRCRPEVDSDVCIPLAVTLIDEFM